MKITSVLALSSAFVAAVAQSAVQDNTDVEELSIPQEAIIGHFTLEDDVFPFFTEEKGNRFIVMVNSSIAEQAYHEDGEKMHKRDAKWGWLKYRPGQPICKRDAKWGWLKYRPGQPIAK